jgi:hypothetical protein
MECSSEWKAVGKTKKSETRVVDSADLSLENFDSRQEVADRDLSHLASAQDDNE